MTGAPLRIAAERPEVATVTEIAVDVATASETTS